MSICFFNNEVSGVSIKCPQIPACSHLRQWDHPVDRLPGIRTVATKSSITQKPDSQLTKTELVSLRSSTSTIHFLYLIVFLIHDNFTHPTIAANLHTRRTAVLYLLYYVKAHGFRINKAIKLRRSKFTVGSVWESYDSCVTPNPLSNKDT